MRPATIRRLLVFGVCLVGVGCLYLVPSIVGAPERVGSTGASSDLPTTTTPETALVTALSAEPTATGGPSVGTSDTGYDPTRTGGAVDGSSSGHDDQPRSTTGRTGATAVGPGRDASTPPEVGRITLVSADAEHLVISWPEVDDDQLVGYEVWLNGFFVVTVPQARARLTWFNDSDTHVIQVRALDDAGQEGPSSPTLLVTRPAPPPEPTPLPASPSTIAPTNTASTSTAPPSDQENAEAPLGQTSTAASPGTAGTSGQEDRS